MSFVEEITLRARDESSGVISGVTGSLKSLVGQIAAMAGVAGAGYGFGAFIQQGIQFNRTMEDSRSGIASLVLANNTLTDSLGKTLSPAQSVSQAFRVAESVQLDLRKAALTTAASYEELVKGFQTAYGPASAAGITSLSKIREITLSASQAVAALGLDSRQTSQEIRAMFTGDQGPDNMLNRTLGITATELSRVKASGEDLGDYLLKKLKPFSDIAAQSMGNFTTVLSNLGDAMNQIAGDAFAPLFREIRAQAVGMGGAFDSVRDGLGGIGQGLAEAARALGPLVQAVGGLGIVAVKAATDFLAAFAPVVPALTDITKAVAGVVDALGTVGLAAAAGGLAFVKLGALASKALYALIGLSAASDAAIAKLIGTVSLATAGWVALGVAVAAAVGWLIKWNYESKADDAWKRAAETQATYIAVLERKYKVQVEANAAEQLLNVSAKERAAIMERVLKTDTDQVVTEKEVRDAIAARTEETLRAKVAAAGLADKQKEYLETLSGLKTEVKLASLTGLDKQLAEIGAKFEKLRNDIRAKFEGIDVGEALTESLKLEKLEKAWARIKDFKAVPEELSGAWAGEMKKVEQIIAYTFTEGIKTGEAAVEEFISVFEARLTKNNALLGMKAEWAAIVDQIPGAAASAAMALRGVWETASRAFDDLFYSVITGRLDSLVDVFRGFADNLAGIFSRLVTQMVQRWLAGEETIGTGLKNLSKSMGNQDGTGLGWGGALMAGGTGWGLGSSIGAGGTANQIGGAVGAIGGAYVGMEIGGIAGPIGMIVGAILGAVIGQLFNKNTERSMSGSLGAMAGATRWDWIPGYTRVNRRTGEETEVPGRWEGYVERPRTAFERSGQKVFEAQTAALADMFRIGAKDQARDLLEAYQKALKESLSGANFKIAAGSQEDIEKDAQFLLEKLLPRIGLSAAFGQKGYLPPGYRDLPGGIPGINYGMPGMNADGTWIESQLFDPDAPIPKLLSGLGFTQEKISELAGRISTDDPQKLLDYIEGIVGVVVGLRDLGAEMGKSFAALTKEWSDEAAAGPGAAIKKRAGEIAGLFDDLTLYSGDEQLAKTKEAFAAASEFWESTKKYLAELDALGEKLSAGLQGMRVKMRDFLNPLSEGDAVTADWSNVEGIWGRLFSSMSPAEIEKAANEAAASIDRIFSVMAERISRGNALLEKTWALYGKLGDLGKDLAFDQLEKADPLRAWGDQLVDMQKRVAKAATLSGLEQISALEDVNASAEEMYQNLRGFLSDIASVSASINKSIDSQIWELGVGEMDPAGQASAITERVRQLQEQLAIATSPAEIQAIAAEIQSLTTRYVGTFGKDDQNRAAAIAWAQEQLERARGLANETLEALRKAGEEQAQELRDLLKGSAGLLSTNVSEAAGVIGQLSHTLGELDKAVQDALGRLGQQALDSLAPLRTAMETASAIFTSATEGAALSLSGPDAFTARLDSGTIALGTFEGAVLRAAGALKQIGYGGDDGTAKSTQSAAKSSRISPAQVVSTVRRYSGSLKPRVSAA